VRAAMLLAERGAHPAVRASMAKEAARLLEHELSAPERAFDVLVRLWEEGDAGVEDELVRLAAALRERDATIGEAAFGRILDGLRKRAEDAWMGEARARLLLRLARVHARGRRDVDAAEAAVEEALAALREESEDADLGVDIELEAASWLFELGRPVDAGRRAAAALRRRPDHPGARELAARLGVDGQAHGHEHGNERGRDNEREDGHEHGNERGRDNEREDGHEHGNEREREPRSRSEHARARGDGHADEHAREHENEHEHGHEREHGHGNENESEHGRGNEPRSRLEHVRAHGDGDEHEHEHEHEHENESGRGHEREHGHERESEHGHGHESEHGRGHEPEHEPRSRLEHVRARGDGDAHEHENESEHGRERAHADEHERELGSDAASAARSANGARADEPAPVPRRAVPPPLPPAGVGGVADPVERRVVLGPGASVTGAASAGVPTRVLVPPEREPRAGDGQRPMGRWLAAEPPEDDAGWLERKAEDLTASAPQRAAGLLRAALALEPHRLSAARALAALPVTAPEVGLARSLVALFEPAERPPERVAIPPRGVRDGMPDDVRELWRTLWEQALPLFREPAPAELQPNERVTRVAITPEARAFSDALAALGRDDLPAFYFARLGEPRLSVVRTSPPSIVAGPGFASDEASMRFAIGRGLELAEPEHVLLATLPAARARVVVSAVSAAFGPADGGGVSREAAVLASELWRTMPPRAQATVRELLAGAGARWNDYDGARQAALAAGLRAGTVAAGDLGAAVRAACELEPELRGLALDREDALREALQSSFALREVVAFAFRALGDR
ncbi:MAG TPA: hypothetical protein VIL20_11105, partial [Sandaracinaceae bacterium]